jgi:hypothetical protein
VRRERGRDNADPAESIKEGQFMKVTLIRARGFLMLALFLLFWEPVSAQTELTPKEARAIAKEAYIYAYPMVDAYRIYHSYFVDKNDPQYKTTFNTLFNTARVYTPADTTVQTPNSDTPYSFIGVDLRTEPLVLTIPEIDKERYFSIQFVDLYTFNYAYIGTRTTGNGGGHYLLAGPNWNGPTPAGIKDVIRSQTQLGLAIYRTQLFKPEDIENVKKIQAAYKVQPLSAYLGKKSPEPAAPIKFPEPLSVSDEKTSGKVLDLLSFLLRYCPTDPSEKELMQRFARLGLVAGQPFQVEKLSPEIQNAVKLGIEDAWNDFGTLKVKVDQGLVTSANVFGTRAFLKNNYLYRMAAAVLGIFGNSAQEAFYPIYSNDDKGQPLDGSKKYSLTFPKGQLPPVKAFWSLTMYQMPSSLLCANPIDRYLINSPMLPSLKPNSDGSITLYIQNETPGAELESNWLPSPNGPFMVVMRLYWPEQAALEGSWSRPALVQAR